MGDRKANIEFAIESLVELQSSDHSLVSSLFETEPVNCPPGSSPFLNAVMEIECNREPHEILSYCQSIEKKLGRPDSHPKNAPRSIDLDILYLGDLINDSPDLILPHPQLHLRLFVLDPLCEIRPDLILPTQSKTVSELRGGLIQLS